MGIGMNFVCSCCEYDSGILMLNQGTQDPIHEVIEKYIHTYTKEIDLTMHPTRVSQYRYILHEVFAVPYIEHTYNYDGCVCYHCQKTYEMLDVLQLKQEKVCVGEKGGISKQRTPLQKMFELSTHQWSSYLGERPPCVFCNHEVEIISEAKITQGLQCPKCITGVLQPGQEFELWE